MLRKSLFLFTALASLATAQAHDVQLLNHTFHTIVAYAIKPHGQEDFTSETDVTLAPNGKLTFQTDATGLSDFAIAFDNDDHSEWTLNPFQLTAISTIDIGLSEMGDAYTLHTR